MASVVLHGNLSIDIFDPATTEWKRWLQRFQAAITIFQVPAEQRVLYLLHYIGSAAFDVICNKMAPADPYSTTLEELINNLGEFYAPEPLEIAENFRFHQRKQNDGEPIKDFVAALQKLSVHCKFGPYLKTALRNQLVFGLASSRAQSRLLETKDLTFDKAVQVATAMELSEKDSRQLQSKTAEIEYVGPKDRKPEQRGPRKKKFTSGKPAKEKIEAHKTNVGKLRTGHSSTSVNANISCYRCGRNHLASKCTLDRNIKCNFCGTPGHLRKVCMGAKRASANQVEEVLQVEHCEHRGKFFKTLVVDGKPLRFEIDSGAAVSIVSTSTVQRLFPRRRLKQTTIQLMTFCKTPIQVIGVLPVSVTWRDDILTLNLYVSEVDREPLLGREWIRQLHLFHLVDSINMTQVIENSTRSKIERLLDCYKKKLDPSLTKIRGLQASLTTKENINPIFLKARTVPFKLVPLVEQELQTLVEDGILEKVNTSRWATPIVPVLKKNNKIRICGDFSVTINPNLLTDKYPLPTVDELFASMAGGTKFTKIDLQQAYLQLEVREEDRELLTLNTHKGLFRSTRLMYGIASAPAIWQREIENILGDIPGVSVFLDDIKITGPDENTHMCRLEQVLSRLADANIRINEEKSEFFKDSILYCGYKINKSGIHKITEKTQAIDNMPPPQNVTELRSFLGMGYTFDIKYKNTRQHCNADCLSRLPVPMIPNIERDVVDVYEMEILQNTPVSTDKLVQATAADTQLQKILRALRENKEIPAKLRFNINQAAFSIQQEVGESVQCRNYSGNVKWKHGKIIHRLGKLHYKIELDDGRVWERHVNQLLRSGEFWDHPDEPQTKREPNVPETPEETEIQHTHSGAEQPRPPEVHQSPERAEVSVQNQAGDVGRPVRMRKPPERYTDTVYYRK
ncbi:uncharacterized protein K02A2.6-like [Nylanderia fulva]|nr:uncharacterized protein K02A2.6-like [Nylanderia fulva]